MTILDAHLPPAAFPMVARRSSTITDFIVHHAAGATTQTVADIDAEHRAIGDAMIGYTWVITQGGAVYAGRAPDYVPAATFGRNKESVAVCLIGQLQETGLGSGDAPYTGPPTPAQIQSLEELCLWAHRQLPSIVRTIGHRDVATLFYGDDEGDYSTACPGDACYALLPKIVSYVSGMLVSGK